MELLIVIGILAVLATVTVLVINPSSLLTQARDSRRLSELQSLNKAVNLFTIDRPGDSTGTINTVYVSLPDTSLTCANLGLPALPAGWFYHCVTEANLRKIDGTGWIPLNLSLLSYGSPFSNLPVDPVNTVTNSLYYTYVTGGSYELTANMESSQYSLGGSKDAVFNDGGDNFISFEIGNDLTLNPSSFDFNNYVSTSLASGGKGGWYSYEGTGVLSAQSGSGDNYLNFNGYKRIVWQQNIPFNSDLTYEISCRVRQVTDPVTGGKSIYCGWLGVAGDGVTLVNQTGLAQYGSQFYHAAGGSSLLAGAGFSTFTGYTSGYGSPNGQTGPCASVLSPCTVHTSVKYLRPYIFLNYGAGTGIADIDYFRIKLIGS